MRIAYVAPRFHTNQIPIVKGWIETGNQVLFISQYTGKSEDYSVCEPVVLGFSPLFLGIERLYKCINGKKLKTSSNPENFKFHYGFPPFFKMWKFMKDFAPDVVVLRERSIYSIVTYAVCKCQSIPCILYNQTPLYDVEPVKTDILHKLVRKMTPSVRITPVLGDVKKGYLDTKAYYVPFVMENKVPTHAKEACSNEEINIVCVAKYEERKNILMLLDVYSRLEKKEHLRMSIIGEVTTPHHKSYYDKVCQKVAQLNLEENVQLYTNMERAKIFDFYHLADLFVLPSSGEFASVSQLEAMACALPVVCSDTNGTSCYIEDGVNGAIFINNDADSLFEVLNELVRDKNRLISMGAESSRIVKEKHSFSKYKENIEAILEGMK